MSLSDPIADMLTRIRNGQKANFVKVRAAYSKVKESIINVMIDEGYLKGYAVEDLGNNKKELIIELKYVKNSGAIKKLDRVSKPGARFYLPVNHLKLNKFYSGLGISIVSTSKGIMSDRDAKKLNVGGEVICNIY